MKTSKTVVTNFIVEHIYGKMNLNCEINGYTAPEAPPAGPNMKKKKAKF